MIGPHPQKIVVMPSLLSLGMMLLAWFDMVSRFSWYSTLSAILKPASSDIFLATWTDSWYQEFSGAMVTILRGWLARLPPAHLAFLVWPLGPPSRLMAYSAADLATVVPSTARLHENGACWSCQVVDRYGSPKFRMPRLANALAYGSDVADISAKAPIDFTVSASASALSRPPPSNSDVLEPTPL